MCVDPITATAFALAVAGSATSAFSAYQTNKSQEAMARFNAAAERDAGYRNELMFRDQARRDIAAQTARMAVSGVALDTGTPLLLLAESVRNKELDAINIRRNADARAVGYNMAAKSYAQAAPLSAAGQLLSGLGSAASAGMSGLGKIGGPATGAGGSNGGGGF